MDVYVRAICFVDGDAVEEGMMPSGVRSDSFDSAADFEAWRESIAAANRKRTTETMHSLFTLFSEQWKDEGYLPMNYFYRRGDENPFRMLEVLHPCYCAWQEHGCLGLPDHKAHQWYSRLLPRYKELLLKEEEVAFGSDSRNDETGGEIDHDGGSGEDNCGSYDDGDDCDNSGGIAKDNREYGGIDCNADYGGGNDDDYGGMDGDESGGDDGFAHSSDDDCGGGSNNGYYGGNDGGGYYYYGNKGGDSDSGGYLDGDEGGSDDGFDDTSDDDCGGGGNNDYYGGGNNNYYGGNQGGDNGGRNDDYYSGGGDGTVRPLLLRKPRIAPKLIGPYAKDGRGSCVVYQADVAAGGCGYVTCLSKSALGGKRKRSVG